MVQCGRRNLGLHRDRGREMASLRVEDNGAMAAVLAPLAEVEEIVAGIDGYVVLANINSTHQVVLGGATEAVGKAVAAVQERGHTAIPLPVSHGFHTEIVAPASVPHVMIVDSFHQLTKLRAYSSIDFEHHSAR